MKKLFILFLLIILSVFSVSTFGQSKYNRYFSDFDIKPENLAKMDKNQNYTFWTIMQESNKNYSKLLKINSKTMGAALEGVEQLKKYQEGAMSYYAISQNERLNFLAGLGGFTAYTNLKIICIKNPEKNACMTPDGLMAINSSLIDCMTNSELLGIMAHEMTHFLLQHSVAAAYSYEKRKNTNRNIAAALTIIAAGAAGYGDAYNGSNTAQVYSDPNYISNFFNSVDNSSHNYYCRYNREQEIECDIIAYRFLEFIGCDPLNYISALRKLGTEHDHLYNKKWNHPTITERISILEALDNKYKNERKIEERKWLKDNDITLKETKISKENATAIFDNLITQFYDKEKYKEAFSEFLKIGRCIYDDKDMLYKFAYTNMALEKYGLALSLFKDYESKYANNSTSNRLFGLYFNIVNCIRQLKQYRQTDAILYENMMLKYASSNEEKSFAYYKLGETYWCANDENSINNLLCSEMIIKDNEEYKNALGDIYYMCAWMYFALDNKKLGDYYMSKAVKLGNTNAIEFQKDRNKSY